MNNQVTSDQIAELTMLLNALGSKPFAEFTDEEYTLLSPIMEAASPLLNELDRVLDEMHDEEEDWD